jgi:hypothetical protein
MAAMLAHSVSQVNQAGPGRGMSASVASTALIDNHLLTDGDVPALLTRWICVQCAGSTAALHHDDQLGSMHVKEQI